MRSKMVKVQNAQQNDKSAECAENDKSAECAENDKSAECPENDYGEGPDSP
jgi:membrane protease subunit (stomatin/prohibitin family)